MKKKQIFLAIAGAVVVLAAMVFGVKTALDARNNNAVPADVPVETADAATTAATTAAPKQASAIVLAFTGDINLDGSLPMMKNYYQCENGIYDCIDPGLIKRMQAADVLFVNNEFTFSNRGSRQQNKAYTFRADPADIDILKEIGVDAASVANNHIFDYGAEAMLDTIQTLKNSNIACVGAGENLAEAMRPVYFTVNGKTVAYVAAGRPEPYFKTPVAGEDSAGILAAYGSDSCVNAIKKAAENSDYVIVYVHWGDEYTNSPGSIQIEQGRKYIAAGADAVIGAHPHVVQGMGRDDGKFIAYSLGNFWFGMKNLNALYLELEIGADGAIRPRLFPCVLKDGHTYLAKDLGKEEEIYGIIEKYSPGSNIQIDENGYVHEK